MQANYDSKGCFVAVVGPSGAGKDTIMDAAREMLKGDTRFHFVRRVITRPQMPGTEDHDSINEQAFNKAVDEGAYALHWQAHGLSYGLPRSMDARLAEGSVVIANVSRRVLADIRRQYQSRSIILITAQSSVLAERLASRGRETREEIEKRLAREVRFDKHTDDVVIIDNSAEVATSVDTFIQHLMKIAFEPEI